MARSRVPRSLLKLDKDVYVGWLGLSEVKIDEPKAWMERLKGLGKEFIVQACDPRFIAGDAHLELLLQQAWEAKRRNRLYAEKFEVDLLMRISCSRQIKDALAEAGVKKGTQDIAVVALGKRKAVEVFLETASGLGVRDDRVLGLSPDKQEFLRSCHGLTEDFLKLGSLGQLLPRFLSEQAALLTLKD